MESADKTLQAIFDQAALGIAQISLDGVWLRVNDRYCQMLGYSESELGTKRICDITHPEDSDEVLAGRRQLLEGAISSHSMEKRYIRKDGTVFLGRLNRSLVRDHDNQPKYFIAVVEDITEKIQAERALRDSGRELVLAQTAACLGIWDRDLQTGFTAVSGGFARLHGLTPDQIPRNQEEWFQLAHPGDRERVRAEYQESLERAHVWETEFRVVWPDGSIHWLLAKGQVFRDDAGRPVRLAGVSLDITERRQAEEALRQSEHMLATELEAAQHLQRVATQLIKTHRTEALYEQVLDAAMAILHSDFASLQVFHLERGTNGELRLLGHRGFNAEAARRWEWVRPTTRTTCGEALCTGRRVVVPDIQNCDFMSGSEDLDGYLGAEIHAGQSTPLVSRSGALLGMVSTYWREPHELSVTELRSLDVLARMATDLIERSRVEEKLSESEERFRNMADTAPVMIWVAGPDKALTFFNKCCLDFTGHSMEQKLGDGWVANLHPEDRDQFLTVYSSSIDARHEFRSVFRLRRADGEYRWVLCAGVPRFAPADTFAGYIGSCVDITELKRTQEEAMAGQKLESLGVLANGIAHDFNNLLGSIMAQAEMVKVDLVAGLSPDGAIAGIKTVAIHGAEIVRQLMTYTGHDQEGFFEPVDLSRLTAEMLELLKVSISKQAGLTINLDKNLPAILGNAPQIRQVLMNLIINASEAIGDKEGVIQVTTSRVPAADYVRLEVSDSGCGMTEEAKAKIFDPFFTTKFAGRGLGLAVVQGIVRAHGGTIDVVSSPGQGATFQVLLPTTPNRALEAQNAVASSGAVLSHALTRSGATVLVVEDEEVLRLAVSKALRIKGFAVMEAKDGDVAIELMRTHRDDIDVILLDVTLPGASSKEVFEEAVRVWANPKVVLTSAYDRRTVESFFPQLRITQFIRKPFQLDDLADTLRKALASPIAFHSGAAQ